LLKIDAAQTRRVSGKDRVNRETARTYPSKVSISPPIRHKSRENPSISSEMGGKGKVSAHLAANWARCSTSRARQSIRKGCGGRRVPRGNRWGTVSSDPMSLLFLPTALTGGGKRRTEREEREGRGEETYSNSSFNPHAASVLAGKDGGGVVNLEDDVLSVRAVSLRFCIVRGGET
jgi:hypothetical protein